MRAHQIFVFLPLVALLLFTGCGDRKDSLTTACEKLEIKHCSRASNNSPYYEINKRISKILETQEAELQLKLNELNRKIDALVSKAFLVDVNRYQDISRATNFPAQGGKKLERVKVFAVATDLPSSGDKGRYALDRLSRHEITVRDQSSGYQKYQQAKKVCDAILIARCKANYTGTLDGVWTEKDGPIFVGWIEYEEFALVRFTFTDLRHAVHEKARKSIFDLINAKNGEISWTQIDAEVKKAVAEIKLHSEGG